MVEAEGVDSGGFRWENKKWEEELALERSTVEP
jgi:hypothetical protein